MREAINRKQQLSITKVLERLQKSILYSFQNEIIGFLDLNEVEEAFNDSGLDDNKLELLLKSYCSNIYLPSSSESESCFKDGYISGLKDCIKTHVLRLSYDRKSYNYSLSDALSRVIVTCDSQHPLAVSICKQGLKDGCIELVYLNSIKTIFDTFERINKENAQPDPFKNSLGIIELMETFLSGIKLCVIQTGNQEDAYTLFEVLNDRSLALDDLDLIKNQFYKCLCISSEKTGLTEQDLDNEISFREEQWGDRVFKNDSDTNKKLIAYLATSYITGSKDMGLKTHDEFRNKIRLYLNSYDSNYTKKDLERDFNIFETIQIIVEEFQMKANNRIPYALKAEFSDKTITYKAVHLLLALGYEGVLAGLINYILQYIKIDVANSDFSLGNVKNIVSELAADSLKHTKVHKQAKIIWKLTLANKDFKKPREVANNLIIVNHVKSGNLVDYQGAYNKSDMEEWLNSWRYGSNDIKVRILFSRILQLNMHQGKLVATPVKHSILQSDIEKFHLDHMEPTKPDETRQNDYYKFGQADRMDDINGLGNMYPLYGEHNISKSNKPMKEAFTYLTQSGLNTHWLFSETQEIFKKNNNDDVPTRDFFVERKNFLIDKFFEAIEM